MSFFDWLLGRTPKQDDPAPIVLIRTAEPAEAYQVVLGATDDPAPPPTAGDGIALRYILEPYFQMIEYTDAKGILTRRRVTTRAVEDRGNARYLYAFCHERNAIRSFRLDRISCLISQDGEVTDAADWFDEILPLCEVEEVARPTRATPKRGREPNLSPYTALRRSITPGLTLLIASARSDDFLHPGEIARILEYVEDEACALRDDGGPDAVDAAVFDKVERTARRLRPTRDDLDAAFSDIAAWPQARKARLAHALSLTAKADGQVDHIEAALLDEFDEAGRRAHGFGWSDPH